MQGREVLNDGFIMSPKNDFVFKLLFGDEKNKDLLIATSALRVSELSPGEINIIARL